MGIYDDIARKIITALEQGQSTGNWQMPWRDINLRPHNPISGTKYRGINAMSLSLDAAMARFNGPCAFATFKQWQSVGASVRKGETAVGTVLVWREVKLRDEGREYDDEEDRKAIRPIESRVFHWNQVGGWQPPELGQDLTGSVAAVDALVKAYGIDVVEGDFASYSHTEDFSKEFIRMPPRAAFIDRESISAQEAYYGTLLHELVHSTGAPSRLGRFTGSKHEADRSSSAYAREELVAELGSAFLSADVRISQGDRIREDHLQYIGGWIEALKADPRLVAVAARSAEQAADHLKEFIPLEHRKALGITLPAEEKARQEQAHKERDEKILAQQQEKARGVEGLGPEVQAKLIAALEEPRVIHETKRGKDLWGRVVDLPLEEAKTVDAYAFKKDGAVFIRERDLRAVVPHLKEIAAERDAKIESREDRREPAGPARAKASMEMER